eukprot:COSAG05_NODE_13613_length_423_cov_1.379630_1_plen_28_part_01
MSEDVCYSLMQWLYTYRYTMTSSNYIYH